MSFFKKSLVILVITIMVIMIIPTWSFSDNSNYYVEVPLDDLEEEQTGHEDFEQNTRGVRLGKVASTKRAAEISDEGMATAKLMLERAWVENVTEADVVRAIDDKMVSLGSSSMIGAFGLLVCSGNDTGEAGGHGPSENDDETNQILPGEVVFVDIGARYNGYVSDITRTFFMGEPTEEMRLVYQLTLDAQNASFPLVKHGTIASDVDKAARKVITDAGYGEHFSHALGHGIGLYVHVPPTISSNSNEILSKAQDHIITIEPGVYIEDKWGIRTEDDAIVDWFGHEIITHYPKAIEDMIIYPPEEEPEEKEEEDKSFWDTTTGKRVLIAGSTGVILASGTALFIVMRKRAKREEAS
jgi:methionine aminopeptidase